VNYFNSLTRQIVHQLGLIKLILINRIHGKGWGRWPSRWCGRRA
jgi:hypothetical protein